MIGTDGRLELVPGADDLLEGPAMRSQAWRLALEWFEAQVGEASRAKSSALAGLLR